MWLRAGRVAVRTRPLTALSRANPLRSVAGNALARRRLTGTADASPLPGSPAGEARDKPVILLLGWLGAKPAHLAKYEQFYSAAGYAVVSYQPHALIGVAPQRLIDRECQRVCARLLQATASTAANPPRVLVHALSNVGTYYYAAFLRFLHTHDNAANAIDGTVEGAAPIATTPAPRGADAPNTHGFTASRSIAGVVVDSAPSEITTEILTRGFTGFLLGAVQSRKHALARARATAVPTASAASKPARSKTSAAAPDGELYHHWLLSPLLATVFALLTRTKTFRSRYSDLRHALLVTQPTVAPHTRLLYLYSAADALIPHTHIEQCIADQRQLLADTTGCSDAAAADHIAAHTFAGSAHVQHLRTYPTEYVEQCLRFAERV